ncbi:hypothetical protein [Rhizobium sp. Root1220]|uniref:hypothetical protein n=1 Tax=Rhizobium sp. Root1220 TaxID=1736432 RepID=UPI0006FD6AE5|nr:hypothetical protein [Rhizobium sp. Root1220]KQV80508.1 hypothetical protein ASC90_25230 [Rhizobium sp. Root1220]
MTRAGGGRTQNSAGAQRGLWRLMLKLPAMRGRLQIMAARSDRFDDLFEAYDEASYTLEALRRKTDEDQAMIFEYATICSEIEGEIISHVLNDR